MNGCGENALADCGIPPKFVEQFASGDNPIPRLDEMHDDIEDFGLNVDEDWAPPQFASVRIDLETSKPILAHPAQHAQCLSWTSFDNPTHRLRNR